VLGDEHVDDGALFDETSEAHRRLRVNMENVTVETLSSNLRNALKPFGRINLWASVSSPSDGVGAVAMSAELEHGG